MALADLPCDNKNSMEIFVFPLGRVVFYPSTSKPLHIYEPRYVQMVRDSLATGTPIAIGYVDEPQGEHVFHFGEPLSFVRPVVGFGHPLILEEHEDGSLMIFLQGQGKARLGRVTDASKPYIVCDSELIHENHEIAAGQAQDFFILNKVLIGWITTHVSDVVHREQFLRNIRSPEEVIGCFASYIVADHDMQQLILESDDINEKIHVINGLIQSGELIA
jgi:ATP-dependent Lon protease